MKYAYRLFKRNLVVSAGVICAAAGLVLTACDRHDTSTVQGTADQAADKMQDAADKTRDAARNAAKKTSQTDLGSRVDDVASKAREALHETGQAARNVANDAGHAIQKTSDDLKAKVSNGN